MEESNDEEHEALKLKLLGMEEQVLVVYVNGLVF